MKALGQRRQPPLPPAPVDGADRQVELFVGHLLDPERVHEGGRGLRVASSIAVGDRPMREGLGSELSWLMTTARSRPSRSSKEMPRPLGRSLRSSTWFLSHPPFCWDARTSQ